MPPMPLLWRRRCGVSVVSRGRALAVFFYVRGVTCRVPGRYHGGVPTPRHCKAGKVRCVSQARSSGSTTPRVTDLSSAKVAATCSSTSRWSRATDSGRSRRARRSSSRSLMGRRARRPATSPNRTKSPERGRERFGAPGLRSLPFPAFQPPHRKGHFSIFHRDAERHFGASCLAKLSDLVFHERRKAVKRHHVVADLPPRVHQRVVERVELVHLAHRV